MGGKNGKIAATMWQRNGTMGGKNGNSGRRFGCIRAAALAAVRG
jgi:hypothetical protein